MKKLITYILFFFLFQQTQAQKILQITKQYYRYDPFKSSFAFFIKNLTDDPALNEKKVLKITDTTLFFFEGTYKYHSPFSYKAEKTKVLLAQQEMTSESIGESLSVFVYQLVGYAPAGADGEKNVKAEYNRFCRKYSKGFSGTESKQFENRKNKYGEICEFKYGDLKFNPVSVAWSSDKNKTENFFVVTTRFIIVDGYAYLPIPSDSL
jgi:hypothetical protein